MAELIGSLLVSNKLGEGVIWDHRRGKVWWTDIEGCTIFSYDPVSEDLQQWSTPERLACFAPVLGQDCMIAAFASGFAFYQPETSMVNWIHKIEEDNPGTRLNDGRTDRQGRFWAGTMTEVIEKAPYKGSLYCLNNRLEVSKHISDLSITNSLCWSPDGARMYHCDTPSRTIQSYDFDIESGEEKNRNTLIKTQRGCYPDGSCIDAQGFLWNAQWGGKKVVRYSPNGEHTEEIEVPASQPSCVAFGGADLDLLFVTSAWQDLNEEQRKDEPQAGNLFIYKTNYKGVEDAEFVVDSGLIPSN